MLGDALDQSASVLAAISGFGPDGFSGDQARNVRNWRIANKTTINPEIGRFDINSWYINNYLYHPIFVVIEQQGETWGFALKFTTSFDNCGTSQRSRRGRSRLGRHDERQLVYETSMALRPIRMERWRPAIRSSPFRPTPGMRSRSSGCSTRALASADNSSTPGAIRGSATTLRPRSISKDFSKTGST